MDALEVLAFIFAVVVLVKLAGLLVSPAWWMDTAGAMLNYPRACTWVYAVLAAVVGYIVFTRMDVVEVVSAMLLTSLLMGVALAPYSETILKLGKEMAGEGFGRLWPVMAIWTVIAVWALYAVLAPS
ncbi:MAG: hypothetical protein OXN22_00705 [Deltaproteobacteria bacterium]|nr:hypothetical protein [Deltaproteobacteria bacterium]